MRKIYILLTNTNTITSRLIRNFTDLEYTHASICLDLSKNEFYTFSRKFTYLLLPGGMIIEHLNLGNFKRFRNCSCRVYELRISNKKYNILKKNIKDMFDKNHKYNVLGLLTCKFNIGLDRPNHRFCSEFVAQVLSDSGIIKLNKPRSLYRPTDFMNLGTLIFQGTLDDLYEDLHKKD